MLLCMNIIAIAAAAAFNLVCSGTEWAGTKPADKDPYNKATGKPFTDTYRVNLERGRWCFNTCDTTSPIQQADEANILLDSATDPDLKSGRLIRVSRETGQLVHRVAIGDYAFIRIGKCEAGPFTSFPKKF